MAPVIHPKLLQPKKQAGFTLIEVLISLFVFSVAALAVAAMTFMSIRGNAMTNQMSQATFLAQDKMEDLLSFRDYTNFKTIGLATINDNVAGDGTSGGVYARSWNVTCDGAAPPAINVTPQPTSCWVSVTVDWADGQGNHQVLVRSLWRSF